MRFTDGREKLEIEIHEGQHSWDTTVGFFDHLTAPIVNGTRQAGNVRTLLTNVYNRILGMSGYPAPEADTQAIYTITDLAGNIVREGSFASSDNPDNMYCSGCGCLLTDENENPCGDTGWCDDCY